MVQGLAAASSARLTIEVGEEYWVTLVDQKQAKRSVPCFCLEVEGNYAVIACPGTHVLSECGEWIKARGGKEIDETNYQVAGIAVAFHRVECAALMMNRPSRDAEDWVVAASGVVQRPSLKQLRKIYYGSEADPAQTDTDCHPEQRRMEGEIIALRKQLDEMKAQGRQRGDGSVERTRHRPQQTWPMTPGAVDEYSDLDEEVEESDGSEDGLGCAALMERLRDLGGLDGLPAGPASKRRVSPDRRASGGGAVERQDRGVGVGADGKAREKSVRRGREGGRDAPGPAGRRRELRRGEPEPPVDKEAMNLMFQMQRMKMMEEMSVVTRDGAGEGADSGELDGMRVIRTLSRMRTLKSQIKDNPRKIIDDYETDWQQEIGGAHKLWTWRDIAVEKIAWGKYRSMLRMYVMMGEVKALMEGGEYLQAEAQLVQLMKATHQFGLTGSWRTAWPYTHLPDPLEKRCHAGTEVEAEAIAGVLKTQDDIRKKVSQATRDLAPADEEDEEEQPGKGDKDKKKTR